MTSHKSLSLSETQFLQWPKERLAHSLGPFQFSPVLGVWRVDLKTRRKVAPTLKLIKCLSGQLEEVPQCGRNHWSGSRTGVVGAVLVRSVLSLQMARAPCTMASAAHGSAA